MSRFEKKLEKWLDVALTATIMVIMAIFVVAILIKSLIYMFWR